MSALLLSLLLSPAAGPPVFEPPSVLIERPQSRPASKVTPSVETKSAAADAPTSRTLKDGRVELSYKGRTWTVESGASSGTIQRLSDQLKAEGDRKPAAVTASSGGARTPYVDPVGFHRHRCPEDGTVWLHRDNSRGADDHDCPKCGRMELNKYRGPLPPTPLPAENTPPARKTENEPTKPFEFVNPLKPSAAVTVVRTFLSGGVAYQEMSDGSIRVCST